MFWLIKQAATVMRLNLLKKPRYESLVNLKNGLQAA